jgi:hypothetical protein
MPLPVGNWDISADGSTGTLSVSASGSGFSGTLFGDPITGFFDETSQCFRFMLSGPGSPPHVQIYAGTLFTTVTTSEVAGATYQTTTYTLGGSFDDFLATGTLVANAYTWLATMSTAPVKTKEAKEKEVTKDTKDVKDGKPAKDIKDSKGDIKEKVHPDTPATTGQLSAPEGALLDHLMQRLSAVEQQIGTGQSFISTDERPPVGLRAIEEPRSGLPS